MQGDPDRFELVIPTAAMLPRLYRLIGEIFEPDRPLMERVIEGAVPLANWDHFALRRGDQIVSHAALVHLQVWLEQRLIPIAGVASVFTLPEYRRSGLAHRVLEAAVAAADRKQETCVLFTSLPRVYEPLGFRTVPQGYRRADARAMQPGPHGFDIIEVTHLSAAELDVVMRIHEHESPHHDGKLLREPLYWPFYQTLFNMRQDICFFLCQSGDRTVGCVRCEREAQAVLVSELSAPPEADDVVRALLARVFDWARTHQLPFVAIALPPTHPAWAVLTRDGVRTASDPTTRELLMVRARPFSSDLSRLQWSLADKF